MKSILFLSIILAFNCRAQEKTIIVFVCEHGGARSTIASVYFNKMAKDYHLPYQSIFRGLTADSSITKETKKGLTEDGFATSGLSPVTLFEKDVTPNVLLISLDCVVPSSYRI